MGSRSQTYEQFYKKPSPDFAYEDRPHFFLRTKGAGKHYRALQSAVEHFIHRHLSLPSYDLRFDAMVRLGAEAGSSYGVEHPVKFLNYLPAATMLGWEALIGSRRPYAVILGPGTGTKELFYAMDFRTRMHLRRPLPIIHCFDMNDPVPLFVQLLHRYPELKDRVVWHKGSLGHFDFPPELIGKVGLLSAQGVFDYLTREELEQLLPQLAAMEPETYSVRNCEPTSAFMWHVYELRGKSGDYSSDADLLLDTQQYIEAALVAVNQLSSGGEIPCLDTKTFIQTAIRTLTVPIDPALLEASNLAPSYPSTYFRDDLWIQYLAGLGYRNMWAEAYAAQEQGVLSMFSVVASRIPDLAHTVLRRLEIANNYVYL